MGPRDIFQKVLDKAPPIPFASKPNSGTTPTHGQSSQLAQNQSQQSAYWKPNFSTNVPISQHFRQQTGQTGWGNNEIQNYTTSPANCFFTNAGQLVVRAIAYSSAPTQEQRYTSARLISHQKLSRQSGCLNVKVTAPCARGVWPAVWLLPGEPFKWPEDGEIDIFESWNGEPVNHSCLHWGNYDGKDWNKHRVTETHMPNLTAPSGMKYSLAWEQQENGKGGRLIWYIDDAPVMKAKVPDSTRKLSDWQIIINVAMGGNVCQGVVPHDGQYDLVIHEVEMTDQPRNGWHGFKSDWSRTKEGHAM